jgi:hypothetical protein
MPLDSIHNVIHQLEQQPRWRSRGQFRQVLNQWTAVVGEGVARQAAPVRLDQDVLHVAVANPMWAQTLSLERRRILAKLNDRLNLNLHDIRFSSGDWYRQNKSAQPSPAAVFSPADLPDWLRQHPSFDPERSRSLTSGPKLLKRASIAGPTLTQQLRPSSPAAPSAAALVPWANSSGGAMQYLRRPGI